MYFLAHVYCEKIDKIIYEKKTYILKNSYDGQSLGKFASQFKTTENVYKLLKKMVNELESNEYYIKNVVEYENKKKGEYEKYKKFFGSYKLESKEY